MLEPNGAEASLGSFSASRRVGSGLGGAGVSRTLGGGQSEGDLVEGRLCGVAYLLEVVCTAPGSRPLMGAPLVQSVVYPGTWSLKHMEVQAHETQRIEVDTRIQSSLQQRRCAATRTSTLQHLHLI